MKLSPVLEFIEKLEANLENDEEWQRLTPEHKRKFGTFVVERDGLEVAGDTFSLDNAGFDKRKLWNIADDDTRKAMARDPHLIHLLLRAPVFDLKICCKDVESNFVGHVEQAQQHGQDPQALDLLRFYGRLNSVPILRDSRQSEGAVSDGDDCRSSVVGPSLKADQIHHNMFRDDAELSFQNFKFFEIGGQRDPDHTLETLIAALGLVNLKDRLMQFLPAALANLDCARSFLSGCSSPDETLTQSVFETFLMLSRHWQKGMLLLSLGWTRSMFLSKFRPSTCETMRRNGECSMLGGASILR